MASVRAVPPERRLVVPIDVGKSTAMALVADASGQRRVAPFTFALDRPGLADLVARVERVAVDDEMVVQVGVEAAGHYHRPVTASGVLPSTWKVLELNPAHVTEQRRVNGKRGIKTDQVDLAAMFDLMVAGRGHRSGRRNDAALLSLQAWAAMRFRRVGATIAVKNQLLGQMDRTFPGASTAIAGSLVATKVGRLVLAEFADPARLARLGVTRFRTFAANRDVKVSTKVAHRFVAAARDALPLAGADTARVMLAADLALLDVLASQVAEADTALGDLLPQTPYAILTTTPGWGVVRAARYGAAVGDPDRWPGPRQIYRAAGLTPKTYESAGRRHDGGITREGSVELRGALLELGMGLWLCDAASCHRVVQLKGRGKPNGIIACAMANRANRIAFAMVRHQRPYDPTRWKA